jgi:hypothetical protein
MSAQRISSANLDSCRQLVAEANRLGKTFSDLIARTSKERPHASDVEALRSLLSENRGLQLWRDTAGLAQLAETVTLERASVPASLKELWKHRLEALRIDLGHSDAPVMEQLLIYQIVLCWLRLNLTEISYSTAMSHSTGATALFWEKRLSAAQRRYTRACETLARVRKLTRSTAILQVNIAAEGGKQVNLAPMHILET